MLSFNNIFKIFKDIKFLEIYLTMELKVAYEQIKCNIPDSITTMPLKVHNFVEQLVRSTLR